MCLLNPTYAQIQKKVMSHSWENIITDGWTDGQTDWVEFIGYFGWAINPERVMINVHIKLQGID